MLVTSTVVRALGHIIATKKIALQSCKIKLEIFLRCLRCGENLELTWRERKENEMI